MACRQKKVCVAQKVYHGCGYKTRRNRLERMKTSRVSLRISAHPCIRNGQKMHYQ